MAKQVELIEGREGLPVGLRPGQLEILQHALGLDQYGIGEPHRNHFCAGQADEADCRELVALGYMQRHLTTKWLPYFNCSVTDAGKEAVRLGSPNPPKLTPGQKRYRAFLAADSGLSFGEWIKTNATGKLRGVDEEDEEEGDGEWS